MSYTLPDWTVIVSLLLALFSIGFGAFSIHQTNETAKRAEEINQYTQKALLDIAVCAAKIETIVGNQQAQQMGLIANTNKTLIDIVAKYSHVETAKANSETLYSSLSGIGTDEHYY